MAKAAFVRVSASALAWVLAMGTAQAQIGGDPVPAQASPDVNEATSAPDIVVTGTLIRGTPENLAVPVDVISSEELAKQGAPTAVDLLKNLTVANGTVGDANQFDNRAQGSEGVASVNLRGLGPQRTLVLLNGKRMVPSGLGIPIVDVNMFPAAAIGRIEILKDGAAATYGSDAIAGVVNFITRTDQEGFLVSGDYRWIDGSKGDYGAAASFGHKQDGFRMFAAVGYQRRSELRFTDRDFAVQPYPTNPQGAWTGGGNPGNFDFNGTVGGINLTTDLGCEGLGGFRSAPGSNTDRCFTQFGQFDNLVEPEERLQAYVESEFDVADNASLRFTGLYAFTNTRVTSSPSYLPTLPPSPNAAFGNNSLFVIPGYAPALQDYCALYGAQAGCSRSGSGALDSAIGLPVLFRPFLLGGNPLFKNGSNDRGSAVSKRDTEALRFTADLNIQLTSDIDFATGFTFSQYHRDYDGTDAFGDLLQNALAGFGGPNCAYASTASRAGLTPAQLAGLAGTNGCTFFNPFSTAISANAVTGVANPNFAGSRNPAGFSLTPGAGLINDPSTIDLFFRTPNTQLRTQQYVGDVSLSGRTGLRLWADEAIGFAVGGQYRKNTFQRRLNADANIAINPCPGTPLNPNATCNPQTGALGFLGTNPQQDAEADVYALFAELQVPITNAVNLQLSARYEDYGGAVGSTFDPQARLKVELTDWLGLRGGVGTSFRGPPPQNLSGSVVSLQVIGTGFRAVEVFGAPNLKPESATTYNAGVLIDRGPFNASLDYWRYEFAGPIESEPVSGLTNALFGATGSANCDNPAYAALRARFTFNAAGCGINNVSRLRAQVFNSADVKTSGLDFNANYRGELGPVELLVGGAATYVIDFKVDDLVVEGVLVQPAFDAVGKLNFQTTSYPIPQWRGNWYVQGDSGPHSLRLQFNYVDGYTDQRGAAIFGPNLGALGGAANTRGKEIGSWRTFDATYRLALDSGTTFTLSAVNIFDRDPPFARLDPNYDSFTASPLGFTLKAAVSQRF
ncbi:TonB-dependent receptor plug domain-containing protein [Sphingomonas sp. IC4-52]|uniref:TonB-dependent receptor plug domain-containing protein n=1 Tax=Sphingomonas sp. IC4-52 TaxID=2887202 RepID=UPI001D109917|nr:TonB-dependent receptor [Sphingomonas sp. IC4-52]MCC2979087.1 TonB-dependent receptor [Sphingomonas sp. IC4-52]